MDMYYKLTLLPKRIKRENRWWYFNLSYDEDEQYSIEYVTYIPEVDAECRTIGWSGELNEVVKKAYEHFKTTGELS